MFVVEPETGSLGPGLFGDVFGFGGGADGFVDVGVVEPDVGECGDGAWIGLVVVGAGPCVEVPIGAGLTEGVDGEGAD